MKAQETVPLPILVKKITYVCGSPYLRDKIIANKSKIVYYIHGHSHDGAVIQNIYKPCEPFPIINPDSLAQGEFAEVIIRKTILNRWKVQEVKSAIWIWEQIEQSGDHLEC